MGRDDRSNAVQQQETQLHNGMIELRLQSREDSGIDDHDESVTDRYDELNWFIAATQVVNMFMLLH